MIDCKTISLSKDEWKTNSNCTCNEFRLKFMCKHIIAFEIQLILQKLPKEGNSTPITQKKPSGRRAQSKHALQKQ